LALLGKSGVGKSSLLAKFDDPASECHDIHNTVGVDMKTYYVVIDEKVVKVIVTDTAG
jgi:GTPase SAR1 family protein